MVTVIWAWSHKTGHTPDCNGGETSPEGIYWELTGSFGVGHDLFCLIHQKSGKGDKRDSGLEEKHELRECNNWSGWHYAISGGELRWPCHSLVWVFCQLHFSVSGIERFLTHFGLWSVSGDILEEGAALDSVSSSEVVLWEAGQGRRWWLSCLCPHVSFPGCGGSQEKVLGDFWVKLRLQTLLWLQWGAQALLQRSFPWWNPFLLFRASFWSKNFLKKPQGVWLKYSIPVAHTSPEFLRVCSCALCRKKGGFF